VEVKEKENIADSKIATGGAPKKLADSDSGAKKNPSPKKEVSKTRTKSKKKRGQRERPLKKKAPLNQELSYKTGSGKRSKSSAPSSGVLQNKAYFDQLSSESEKQDKDGYQKRLENAEELSLVPAKTIDSVTSKYGARDYSGTIQAADEFVGLKSGTRTERARALQLKAQSLANLGRFQEALRVYDSILKKYKTFQSSAISSARAQISRKLEERQPKRKKAKSESKKSTYDFSPE